MKIKIYAIGYLKEMYLKLAINAYVERLKPYTNLQIIEVADEAIGNNPNAKDIEIAKNKEGKKVLKLLKKNEYLVGLDLTNKQLTSEQFAVYLQDKLVAGRANLSFVIGGSHGLSKELKGRCQDWLALSKMTFLHQMTRLILLEQIYRAFKINRNEPYHK
ncbi:MAG: 23S rRNA (pseudouridine(1915)-N(3))-methyltransferase RlmH [Erysipelotrichia bacterium]|nr:23S rRNA (pseudouridine(1915)-N(3))-methyltransferase RlmH [Erysipelotrichia bacterium]